MFSHLDAGSPPTGCFMSKKLRICSVSQISEAPAKILSKPFSDI
ncbi:Uncharacterized protein EbC_23200 [Erwinia billingiae Eb661]|uniref:Uncharacterized protein n=1 Tax=Erwinia billingiae (strain Eb661) TaxID=634500 RepID=D8MSP4_ERWBE|nr:Uncharacterized protein EbC_23200 [Erwinia billingiae Eb661]